jgi:glutaredoxin
VRLTRRRRPKPGSVVLLTRAGCTLCEAAEPVVARAAAEAGVPLEVRDIDADPTDREKWSDLVPVVLLDGQQHAFWKVDERRLRRALHLRP